MTDSRRRAPARAYPLARLLPHLLVVLGFVALFGWMFARFFLYHRFLADSDLYEYFLPLFLSPIKLWSSFEFSGLPAFADPGQFTFYPPNLVFATLLHSWTLLAMSAYVLAASFTYAYVYSLTGSRTGAAFSALAYSLSEAMLERLAHFGSVHAIAWLPLIALAVDRVRQPSTPPTGPPALPALPALPVPPALPAPATLPAFPLLTADGRAAPPYAWVAVGGLAVASGILAGHPQPALYMLYATALYALTGLLVERAGWRSYAATAALFLLGLALTAVKSIPFAEATTLIARQEISFERFVGRTLEAPQMLSFLFPTVAHGDTRELPTYVGAATLMLALAATARVRANWRVAFWAGVAIVAVLLALGPATPLIDAAYHVPMYDRMRNLGRHLFLFAFGASVLAGFAIAAIQSRDLSRTAVVRAAAGVLGLVAVGALLMAVRPGWFEIEGAHRGPGPGPLSILSAGVWIQIAIVAATTGLVVLMHRSRLAPALLIALLVVDLLNALPYDVDISGVELTSIRESDLSPSVHAEALAREMAATGSRALAVGGTQIDEVIPAAFARVWRIPIAGGYGPMLLNRYSELAYMGTNGEVRPAVLDENDVALDLLSVRFAIVNQETLDVPAVQRALGTGRWREHSRFLTSRTTDRGANADNGHETDVTVFENLRALPRAWFVDTLLPLEDDAALRAVHGSPLPDGRRFDPRTMAAIDPAAGRAIRPTSPGASTAGIVSVGDGEITLSASTAAGGFMVLNENFYPGWRARIDSMPVPIYRADVSLQGVVVPPGLHRITFTLESPALRAGYGVSLVALAVWTALLVAGLRQWTGRSTPAQATSPPAPEV